VYTSFTIKNFRCFEQLTIEPLARINLIAGKNNTGKTALLEALWLHSGPNVPDLGIRLASFRGIPGQDPRRLLHDLFYNSDPSRTITLSAKHRGINNPRKLDISSRPFGAGEVPIPFPNPPSAVPRGSQEPDVSAASSSKIVLDYTDEFGGNYVSTGWWATSQLPPIIAPLPGMAIESAGMARNQADMPPGPPSIFLSPRLRNNQQEELARFGDAELTGFANKIVDCLRVVEPRIKRLTTIAAAPTPMLYADVGLDRLVPLGFMGDGIGRLLSMTLALYSARDGTILIDEVENGLHHSVLPDVWQSLYWLSREFNVQVVATTHSYECLVAARDAFKANEDQDFLIHRLGQWENGPIKATTYSFEGLDFTLDYGAEVR
jgi:hypothetical protein